MDLFPWINMKGTKLSKKACVSDFWRDDGWHLPITGYPALVQVLDFLQGYFSVNSDEERDRILWKFNKKGEYNIGSIWRNLIPIVQDVSWAKLVWSKCIVPRHAFICWLALHKKLLTRDRLFA